MDPLVSKWCNAKILQICSDEETNWMAFIFGWTILLAVTQMLFYCHNNTMHSKVRCRMWLPCTWLSLLSIGLAFPEVSCLKILLRGSQGPRMLRFSWFRFFSGWLESQSAVMAMAACWTRYAAEPSMNPSKRPVSSYTRASLDETSGLYSYRLKRASAFVIFNSCKGL